MRRARCSGWWCERNVGTVTEPTEEIDVRNNPESRAAEANAAPRTALGGGGDGGAPPRDAPAAGELPETSEGGTASGDPVAGVTISDDDLDEAVSADTGPTGDEGPPAGHA